MRTENPFASPEDDYSRFGSATASLPQFDNYTNHGRSAPQTTPQPPRYSEVFGSNAVMERQWYNPLGWSGRKKLIVAGCVVVVIVAVIVGAVEGVKANAYPNYSQLNYTLVDTFSGSSFFDNFEYYTSTDPTNGWVQYVDSQTASMMNLTYASDSTAVIKVDTDTQNQTSGRKSVRITSTNTYDNGLFIFDVVHTPYGCATWPALWLTDPSNWPEHGEIDVMESNNKGTQGNDMTLHTTSGCKMNAKRKETGTALYSNCLNTANDNAGCGVKGKSATYGEAFNNNGGGVYAMELRDAGIRVWMFSRDDIPSDISNSTSSPDPSTWGEALADFPSTHCDISSHFKNQSIIANIDICGDLAGATSYYTTINNCPDTCTQFAAENGANFTNAYWEFNSFKVYQTS
ncbi:putative glycosidase C21B10.07 [Penicillium brasilianum]|uniref:endo-1,3(4)-beta-glucanase n=1 Tax=Penicillium brasilianum TaxID=104259 RepID=A0A1S9RQP0_PENBI|nr:putative glycosidase C21B10.07 [Penicillium brasilianum]